MHLLHARKVGTKTVKIYLDPEPRSRDTITPITLAIGGD